MMNNSLEGKKALVTGATGGIGKAIVELLDTAGVRVVATARSQAKLNKIKNEFPDVETIVADLELPDQVEKLAEAGIRAYAGLDILVNNAGIGINGEVSQIEFNDFNRMFAVNVNAVFILSKIIGAHMTENRSGYIINIGSGASTTPIAGYAGYCATKHALLGFSESFGLELRKYGVKVSIVLPGSTATRFGGSDAEAKIKTKPGILKPSDIAESVINLLNQPQRAWTSQVNLRPLDLSQQF